MKLNMDSPQWSVGTLMENTFPPEYMRDALSADRVKNNIGCSLDLGDVYL